MDKETLLVEREGAAVRITVNAVDEYAAIRLYDEVVESARRGEIVLGVTLLGDNDPDQGPPGEGGHRGNGGSVQAFPAGGPRR